MMDRGNPWTFHWFGKHLGHWLCCKCFFNLLTTTMIVNFPLDDGNDITKSIDNSSQTIFGVLNGCIWSCCFAFDGFIIWRTMHSRTQSSSSGRICSDRLMILSSRNDHPLWWYGPHQRFFSWYLMIWGSLFYQPIIKSHIVCVIDSVYHCSILLLPITF